MEDDTTVVATYIFRGVEYVLTMNIEGNTLVLEVEDKMTADQWKGTFDAAYIEDLTHKTGNFKQFAIFVSMLESALVENSDTVTLDLLTYADLESLRQRKTGVTSRNVTGTKTATLNSKRYLILTYTVEFDRIHYPLPLPYSGKPDPKLLQDTIRELRLEIKQLKSNREADVSSSRDFLKLQRDYDRLLQEKEDTEADFIQYKRELKNTTKGNATKEIRILKNLVKNLEEELMKEKTKHQRSASKRSQEYKQLLADLEDLRASERNLKIRIKSLTNELAIYKRRGTQSPYVSNRLSQQQRQPLRSQSRERPVPRERSTSRERSRLSLARGRSSSQESLSRNRERSLSRDRRPPSSSSLHGQSQSPAGGRGPRFDPTAYIREKQRRQKETTSKHRRQVNHAFAGSQEKQRNSSSFHRRLSGNSRPRSRTSSVGSVGSIGSRRSSHGSLSDIGVLSDSSQASQTRQKNTKRALKPRKTSSSNVWISPSVPLNKKRPSSKTRLLSSTPDSQLGRRQQNSRNSNRNKENEYTGDVPDSDYFDRSAEISEIDARLERLQQFMKSNMP